MVSQGYYRPLLVIVLGWCLATRQMLRKHASKPDARQFFLLPAYCFFYTMVVTGVFVLVYQEWDRRQGEPDPSAKCSEYFYDTYDKFGFLVDSYEIGKSTVRTVFRANSFLFRLVVVMLAQAAVAFGFAWHLRRRSAKVRDAKAFRDWTLVHSVGSLAAAVLVFTLATAALPPDGDPGAPGDGPCAWDPVSSNPWAGT